jgi:hypothetical protein
MHTEGKFCDLVKALDCGYHEVLLAKLHFYCIQGTISVSDPILQIESKIK